MGWIKRNLFFFIGSVLALVLMGLAGWFLYSKWDLNNQVFTSLNETTEKLRRLSTANPHPGNDKIDNVGAATNQTQQVRGYIKGARAYFKRIAPIPDEPKIDDHAFSTALSRTLNQLQRDATNSSVTLPPSTSQNESFAFSLSAQRNLLSFAPGSLQALAVQLGEIKTICDVLYEAKVNSLDNIRRERVSADDANGSQSDYLIDKSTTNELAIITPYELTFRCFSSELAAVLAGFASSPYGLLVKNFNVEPAPPQAVVEPTQMAQPVQQTVPVMAQPHVPSAAEAERMMRERYGLGSGSPGDRYGGGGSSGGIPLRGYTPPTYAQQPAAVPQPGAVPSHGLNTVLDERLLKITMNLVVVKLLPPKP